MSILCLIKYIKPKHEIIYLDQRNYEIPKFSKTKVKFEISPFEIWYRQNFVGIRKLIVFGPKCPNLSISEFLKTNVKFEISTFEIGYMWNFVKIRELILFGPKCPNLSNWDQKVQRQVWNQHIQNRVYAKFH